MTNLSQQTTCNFLISSIDSYPFGMTIKNRSISGENYKFGMNGQNKDDEIYGEGNTYSAQYWEYDARLGRRWNLDPVDQISISNYACFANNPIAINDVNGDKFNWINNLLAKHQERKTWRQIKNINNSISYNESIGNDVNILKERKFELYKSLVDIKHMREDPKTQYKFRFGSIPYTPIPKITMPVVKIYAPMFRFSLRLHENRHGGQIARGMRVEDYGVQDEIDAHKAEFAYDGILIKDTDKIFTLNQSEIDLRKKKLEYFYPNISESKRNQLIAKTWITSLSEINIEFINSIQDNNGNYVYPIGKSIEKWNEN